MLNQFNTIDYLTAHSDVSHFELLENLVNIDSQVKNLQGILTVQKRLARLYENLGFEISFYENEKVLSAPLLVARKILHPAAPTVTFIGHSDVVTSIKRNPFRLSGNKVIGAGVADDKGGLVVCFKAIERYLSSHSSKLSGVNINVVVSPSEETGSIGFHHIFKEIGEESQYVFGLEPALSCGSLISSRSGNRWYHLMCKGISAHAGRFGHDHINAAHSLSMLISSLHVHNCEKGLRRINVGSMGSDHDGFNTICGRAWAKIDTRFSTFECRDLIHGQIENAITQARLNCPYSLKQSQFIYSIEDDCPPLEAKNFDSSWNKHYVDAISSREERSVTSKHAGGAADVNYFANRNNQLLDGMGPVGGGLHTPNEYIEKDSLITRTRALEELLTHISLTQ